MRIIKPKALRHGDVIGIAAPASPPVSEEKLAKGISYLERLGYRIELGKNLYRKRGYLAGTDGQRASDIHELFVNKKVKAIFNARGGFGCMRILPLLDYNLIRRHPKIFVGYSDVTVLQLALFTKIGLATFSGPMVAVEMADGLSGTVEEQFWKCLTHPKALDLIYMNKKKKKVFQKGNSTGRIIGGNLSLIAAMVGTPYFPSASDLLLVLEEIGERPYRIDRMLRQLQLANVLKKTKGVLLGSFDDCEPEKGKPSLALQQVFNDIFANGSYPVMSGLSCGHRNNSLTIPLGVRARIDTVTGALRFLENAVE